MKNFSQFYVALMTIGGGPIACSLEVLVQNPSELESPREHLTQEVTEEKVTIYPSVDKLGPCDQSIGDVKIVDPHHSQASYFGCLNFQWVKLSLSVANMSPLGFAIEKIASEKVCTLRYSVSAYLDENEDGQQGQAEPVLASEIVCASAPEELQQENSVQENEGDEVKSSTLAPPSDEGVNADEFSVSYENTEDSEDDSNIDITASEEPASAASEPIQKECSAGQFQLILAVTNLPNKVIPGQSLYVHLANIPGYGQIFLREPLSSGLNAFCLSPQSDKATVRGNWINIGSEELGIILGCGAGYGTEINEGETFEISECIPIGHGQLCDESSETYMFTLDQSTHLSFGSFEFLTRSENSLEATQVEIYQDHSIDMEWHRKAVQICKMKSQHENLGAIFRTSFGTYLCGNTFGLEPLQPDRLHSISKCALQDSFRLEGYETLTKNVSWSSRWFGGSSGIAGIDDSGNLWVWAEHSGTGLGEREIAIGDQESGTLKLLPFTRVYINANEADSVRIGNSTYRRIEELHFDPSTMNTSQLK